MCPFRREPIKSFPRSWAIKDVASLLNLAMIARKERPIVRSPKSGITFPQGLEVAAANKSFNSSALLHDSVTGVVTAGHPCSYTIAMNRL